jgi:hypothetical protein
MNEMRTAAKIRHEPGLKRDTLGKLLVRVKKEVQSQPRRHYRLPSYLHELSAPLQTGLRHEIEQKTSRDFDQKFSFTPEQIGWLVIRYFDGQKVEPL